MTKRVLLFALAVLLSSAGGAAIAIAGRPALPLRPLASASPERADRDDHVLVEVSDPSRLRALPGKMSQVDGRTWRVTGPLSAERVAELTGLPTRDDVPLRIQDTNDTYWSLLWGLDNRGGSVAGFPALADADVDGVEADAKATGRGVVVAVVDTGVQPDHPDLPALWRNPGEVCGNGTDDDRNGYVDDCGGWDFVHHDNTTYDAGDTNDHGTHVAGTIAAVPNNGRGVAGLAPGATIMSLKITATGSIWMSDAAEAFRYAADNGARVINASFATSPGTPRAAIATLESAVEYARGKGVLVVAAAGNDGVDVDASAVWPASLDEDNVITVGASTAAETVASFSNRGAAGVDLFAPGHYIASTVDRGGYAAMQGTSMAAPHVAAAAALLLSAQPGLSPAAIRAKLMSDVDTSGVYTGKAVSGGRLNADRLISGSPVSVDAAAFANFTAGTPHTGTLTIAARPSLFPAGSRVAVVGTLLASVGGATYGVVEHPVTVDGASTATDEAAQVALGPVDGLDPAGSVLTAEGLRVSFGTTLPAGDYALVVELVAAGDPLYGYGPPVAVFFTVPPVGGASPAPAPSVAPVPGPTQTTTVGPAPAPTDGGVPSSQPVNGQQPPPGGGSQPPAAGGQQPTAPGNQPAPGGGSAPQAPQRSQAPQAPQSSQAPQATQAPPAPPASQVPGQAPPAPGNTPAPVATTVPPGPGGGAPAPEPPPAPVTDDGITITGVSPNRGPAGGGTTIMIVGANFPQYPVVSIGGAWAYVSSSTSVSITVVSPSGVAGSVADVLVGDRGGRSVTMPRAFRYDAAPATNTPDSNQPNNPQAPAPTGSVGPAPTGPAPTSGPTAPQAPAPTVTAPSQPAASPGPAGATRRTLPQFGPAVPGSGLRLAPITGGDPLAGMGSWSVWRCAGLRCSGVPVR